MNGFHFLEKTSQQVLEKRRDVETDANMCDKCVQEVRPWPVGGVRQPKGTSESEGAPRE